MSDNSTKKTNLFFGGVPIQPDVDAIMAKWPVAALTEGTSIPEDEIARLINVPWNSHRYNTVVAAWRKRMFRDHNILMAKGGRTLTILTPDQRIDYAGARQKTGVRAIVRGGVYTETTDRARLSPEAKAVADSRMFLTAMIRGAERTMPKPLPAADIARMAS